MPKLTWYITRLHRLLGLVIGAQLLIWTVSGFFFTLKPIEQVRGTHLRADVTLDPATIPPDLVPPVGWNGAPVLSTELKRLGDMYVWEVTDTSGNRLHNAATGDPRPPHDRGRHPRPRCRPLGRTGRTGDGGIRGGRPRRDRRPTPERGVAYVPSPIVR